MTFPSTYKCLTENCFQNNNYQIVPIRYKDRYDIMKWRNEQIYHLRQNKPLTKKSQDEYFKNVISKLFDQDKPNQILFSFLKDDICIGYGGLVHINWVDKNAEISFVMNTQLENEYFEFNWVTFLNLLEKVAFNDLMLHKIFTFAFDLRPKLYNALEKEKFVKEATLKEHCFFNNKFIDVIIHQKTNSLFLRKANKKDAELLFKWANDKAVRKNAINTEKINWENHLKWFKSKLQSNNAHLYILEKNKTPIGQIRIDKLNNYWIIDYSIDKNYRGLGYGKLIVKLLINLNKDKSFIAQVKKENIASISIFEKIGFLKKENNSNELIEYIYE